MEPDEQFADRLATRTDRLRAVMRLAHERNSVADVLWPDNLGRFPEARSLPWIFPLVVDANALRDEILRVDHPRTVLSSAANQGVLRLYCAPHVVEEVADLHVKWATAKGVSASAVRRRWETSYLPLLRCVEVPKHLTGGEQASRLHFLATSKTRYGDPDDVPSATLAILLAAPLLSRDKGPLRAVYGPGFDHIAHAQWIDKLRAAGDLGLIGTYVYLVTGITTGVGKVSYSGVKALGHRVGWPAVAAVGLAGLAAYRFLTPARTKSAITSALGETALALFESIGAVGELRATALTLVESLSPAAPDWARLRDEVGYEATLSRACMYNMARNVRSTLSAAELSEKLHGLVPGVPCGVAKVRHTLRTSVAFEQPTPGRFQLGAALVRGDANQSEHEVRI